MAPATYSDHVLEQREVVPAIYGGVDFDVVPERLDDGASPDDERFDDMRSPVERVFERADLREIVREATMTGDRVADAYAALIPELGFQTLVQMLETACAEGIDAVEDAPHELVELIAAMEATPDWVDMELVREGAAAERIPAATAVPFAIRGAFLATFLNKYAALPMTMTGALSDDAAAKRVFETASFFSATTLPGALDRWGKGFEAAAKVRLMHSMVRFHLLNSGRWDVGTYGIPIPQVDQMPAGMLGVFTMSSKLLKEGRSDFDPIERASVELSRYRCFLLGLPENLLGTTPGDIVDLMIARHVSLREGYDDDTCGVLVRGTLDAELFDTSTIRGRTHSWLERGFSKFVLVNAFLGGDTERASSMGIDMSATDKVSAVVALATIATKKQFYVWGLRLPRVGAVVDRRLNARIADLLDTYGHADFVTDAAQYRLDRR